MKLLLHIFRKDVHHFFPEILVHLALLIAFAWAVPYTWFGDFVGLQAPAAILLRLLIPLSWLIMISRVLHDEAFVGDRQFWITRPYPWPTLLAEKALFVIFFLHLPVFLMQAYLVQHAGFAVTPLLGRLVYFQCTLATLYVLPMAALTVVTASFGRQFLTVLAGLIYVALILAGTSSLLSPGMLSPYFDRLSVSAVLLALAAVITFMYARRRTLAARITLLALPLAIAVLAFVLPTRLLTRYVYANDGNGNQLQFDTDPQHRASLTGTGDPLDGNHDALVSLPLQLHTTGRTHEATVAGAQFTLHAADGTTWTSSFQSVNDTLALDSRGFLTLHLPASIYRRFQSQPTTVQMEAALEAFAFPSPETLTVPADTAFTLTNGGHCAPSPFSDLLQCRYALQTPPPTTVALTLQAEPCNQTGHPELVPRRTDGALHGTPTDLDPISISSIPLSHEDEATRHITDRQLCPGAQASFATEQSLGLTRLFVTTPPLHLRDYAVPRHPERRNTASGASSD